jgi:hypothetical protein
MVFDLRACYHVQNHGRAESRLRVNVGRFQLMMLKHCRVWFGNAYTANRHMCSFVHHVASLACLNQHDVLTRAQSIDCRKSPLPSLKQHSRAQKQYGQ